MGCLKLHIESEPRLKLIHSKKVQKPSKKTSNYYPFGLKQKGYNNTISSNGNDLAQAYKFAGKEYNEELGLNWYDITARNYDPAIGRWMNIDPLAEMMRSQSVYNYAFNSPTNLVDSDGMAPVKPEKIITKVHSSTKTSANKVRREMSMKMTLTVVNMSGSDLSSTMFNGSKGNVSLDNFKGWGDSYILGAGVPNDGIDSSLDKITSFEIDYVVVNSIDDIREGDNVLLVVDELKNKEAGGLNDGRVSAVESNNIESGDFDEVAQHEIGHSAGAGHSTGLMGKKINKSKAVSRKTRGEITTDQTYYNGVGTYDDSQGNIQYENTTAKKETQKFIDKHVKNN